MSSNDALARKAGLDPTRLPRHVAIIMDGNGRWAKQRSLDRLQGHRQGVKAIERVLQACLDLHLPYLTLFAFSTENWRRPVEEVNGIMALLKQFLAIEKERLKANGVRLNVVGELDMLTGDVQESLAEARAFTSNCSELVLTVALSYGGRAEIAAAVRKIAADVREGRLAVEAIDEERIAGYLYMSDIPDPDLLIRTSGEVRISNFLLWQLAYSEIFISDTYWPDFDEAELVRILQDFQGRKRRFGNI